MFMGPTWDPSGATRTQVTPCWPHEFCYLGRCPLTSIGNNIMEIRQSYNCLITRIVFPILVRCHIYIEMDPGAVTHGAEWHRRYSMSYGLWHWALFQCKDQNYIRLSYLYDRNSYTNNMVSLYWNGPMLVSCCGLAQVNFTHILQDYFTRTGVNI